MDDNDGIYRPGEIEPRWEEKFNVSEIEALIKEITDKFFVDNPYNVENSDLLSAALAKKIRDLIRDMNKYIRYKISVQVFLGENREQKVFITAKGYWDNYVDNYSTYTHHGEGYYCTVFVMGLYTD